MNFGFLYDKFSTLIRVTADIEKFLFDYKYSVFHECNKKLAEANFKRIGQNYTQNSSHIEKVFDGIKYIAQTLETLYKPYFLFSGTLLGKILE